MNNKEYVSPELRVIEIAVATVIAASYGELGYPGGPLDEGDITDW